MSEEIFPLLDEKGDIVGTATRGECHSGSKLLHPVVHLHLFNSRGELYLQHRPAHKEIQPNRWDTAVGGHIDHGETVEEALRREANEELGVIDFVPLRMGEYIFESDIEREWVHSFSCLYDGPVVPHVEELDGGRFWTHDEIKQQLGKGVFTPNFESEYERYIRSRFIFYAE